MSSVDPFSSRFEVFGREARQVVPEINEEAYERLIQSLSPDPGADGRVVLLSAPRAGYGKTLLIQRVAESLTEQHHFVRVSLMGGRTIDAAHVLEFVLESLCQVLPAADGLTMLDLVARRIIARGLEPLVRSGEVPCQDRDGALVALRDSPVETFDFHHESAVTAHWTEANFEILGPRLAAEVAQVSGASLREAAYWVELFFRFATTSPENVERSRLLFETVFRPEGLKPSDSGAGERLHGLLSLLNIAMTVVLVIDDTEGLSTHPPDALELASFLTNLAQSCPGTLVLLSVNTDVWETAFAPRLPGGLSDRLTEHRVMLKPLSSDQAENIIRSRGGTRASEVLERINWGEGDLYARRVLKAASEVWDSVLQEEKEEQAAAPGESEDQLAERPEESKDALQEPEPKAEPEPERKAEPEPEPKAEPEPRDFASGAAPVSFSPGAATFLTKDDGPESSGEEIERPKAEIGSEAPVDETIAVDLRALDAFKPSVYATPETPLTDTPEGEEFGDDDEESPVVKLAKPSQPLVPEAPAGSPAPDPFDLPPRSEPPVVDRQEEAKPAKEDAPSQQGGVPSTSPAIGFSPVQAEAPSKPAAGPVDGPETPESATTSPAEASGQATDGSVSDEPTTKKADATPAKSPFAKLWERADLSSSSGRSEFAMPESKDSWAEDLPAASSNPLAGVTPTVPPSPFEPVQQEATPEDSPESPQTGAQEEAKPCAAQRFGPVDTRARTDEATPVDDAKPSPSPSPFEPVMKSPEPEATLSSEPAPGQQEPPFNPPSSARVETASSPFEAVTPDSGKRELPEETSSAGLDALMGGASVAEPVSPFEKGDAGGGKAPGQESPPPFKPVGDELPPKRTEPSPFEPVTNPESSPFEKVSGPAFPAEPPSLPEKVEPSSPTSGPPPIPAPSGEKEADFSPFAPVEPAPERSAPSPFEAIGDPPSPTSDASDDEDKVDELLRQFKKRYGRD